MGTSPEKKMNSLLRHFLDVLGKISYTSTIWTSPSSLGFFQFLGVTTVDHRFLHFDLAYISFQMPLLTHVGFSVLPQDTPENDEFLIHRHPGCRTTDSAEPWSPPVQLPPFTVERKSKNMKICFWTALFTCQNKS